MRSVPRFIPRASQAFLLQGVGHAEQRAGAHQQLPADVAELDWGLMASKQLHPQLLLQGFDRMGHGRLTDPQAKGRTGETLQFGDPREYFQLREGHEYLLILR